MASNFQCPTWRLQGSAFQPWLIPWAFRFEAWPFLMLLQGSSKIHGPQDVVSYIQQRLSPIRSFSCSEPHNLSFQIGGKIFPVDPRDFATQASGNVIDGCVSTLITTDSPSVGNFLFSWVLGVPFLKGWIPFFDFYTKQALIIFRLKGPILILFWEYSVSISWCTASGSCFDRPQQCGRFNESRCVYGDKV